VKKRFKPVLTKEAEQVISSYYHLQRQSGAHNAGQQNSSLFLPRTFFRFPIEFVVSQARKFLCSKNGSLSTHTHTLPL
jgi:hypothetical protein